MAADPQYLRLYHEYSNAIRAYENALRHRQHVRRQLSARRRAQAPVRRPVGSPVNYRIPQSTAVRPPAGTRPPERRIYLGDILGWAKITYTSPPVTPMQDPAADFDVNKLYDTTSMHLYWNAKNHYQKCKQAFFDYVRRRNIDLHKQRAVEGLSHAANLQFRGADGDESVLEGVRREVEGACQNALAVYRSTQDPTNDEVKTILVENLADAYLVGLAGSTVNSMEEELNSLIRTGSVTIGW